VYVFNKHKLKNGDEDRAVVLLLNSTKMLVVQDYLYVQLLSTVRYRARNTALKTKVYVEV
jgi:hypothetical protein